MEWQSSSDVPCTYSGDRKRAVAERRTTYRCHRQTRATSGSQRSEELVERVRQLPAGATRRRTVTAQCCADYPQPITDKKLEFENCSLTTDTKTKTALMLPIGLERTWSLSRECKAWHTGLTRFWVYTLCLKKHPRHF